MSDRQHLIEKLVSTLHVNVAERTEFVERPLRLDEVISAITSVLLQGKYFPRNARPWREGEIVFEGHILEVLPTGTVRMWIQRNHPINPYQLAEQRYCDYPDMKTAVERFVANEWQGQIDGIAIGH